MMYSHLALLGIRYDHFFDGSGLTLHGDNVLALALLPTSPNVPYSAGIHRLQMHSRHPFQWA
jgi:hypothetical protein